MSNTRILFFDTETTGKEPQRARIVELACLLCEIGPQFEPIEVARFETLIHPEEMDQFPPPEATRIHGITGDEMLSKGIPLKDALDILTDLTTRAREAYNIARLVAHNIRYDSQVVATEYQRVGSKTYPLNFLLPFCTMKATENKCCLPGKYGNYKWPTLREAWEFCFDRDFSLAESSNDPYHRKAHRAMFDTERCKDIYFHGLQEGWWHRD